MNTNEITPVNLELNVLVPATQSSKGERNG